MPGPRTSSQPHVSLIRRSPRNLFACPFAKIYCVKCDIKFTFEGPGKINGRGCFVQLFTSRAIGPALLLGLAFTGASLMTSVSAKELSTVTSSVRKDNETKWTPERIRAATPTPPEDIPITARGPVAPQRTINIVLSLNVCDPGAARFAVGQAATPSLIESIRQRSNAQFVRVLPTGAGATRDYIANRINIQLDEANRIVDIRCG
jgi:Peptidase inhibitor I78 family